MKHNHRRASSDRKPYELVVTLYKFTLHQITTDQSKTKGILIMYYGIHYLRGIAALMVVMHHCAKYLPENIRTPFFGGAASGVDIFFMISGFIIVVATQNKEANTSLKFVGRRVFRIYPALIFCMLVGFATIYSDKTWLDIARAVVPLPIDYTLNAPAFGYNLMGPAWTLTYEIMFYSFFCLAMAINHKHRTLIASALMSIQCFAIQTYFNGEFSFSAYTQLQTSEASPLHSYFKNASSPMFFEFIYGMVIAELFVRYRQSISKNTGLVSVLLGSSIYFWLYASQSTPGFGITYFGMWSAFLFAGVCIYQASNKIPLIKPFILLGNISYSIYISHYVVIGAVEKNNMFGFNDMSQYSKFIMILGICTAVGVIVHHTIEKPFIKIGKLITESSTRPPNQTASV